MNLYAVLRRSGWATPEELEAAAARSSEVGEQLADQVRWIRTYILEENDHRVGTVCIYQAVSADAIRTHASRALLPVDDVIPVAETVIVRPDPEPAAA